MKNDISAHLRNSITGNVDINMKSETESGSILPVQYTITQLKNTSQNTSFHFRIDCDKRWIVSGRDNGKFTFDDSGRAVISVSIFPLKSGKVLLPTLHLFSNSEQILDETIKINSNSKWINVIE